MVHRQRVRDVIGRPPAGVAAGDRRRLRGPDEPLGRAGARRGRGSRPRSGPAPASASRTRSRTASGDGAERRHRRVRQDRRGSSRSRGRGRPPRSTSASIAMSRRQVGTIATSDVRRVRLDGQRLGARRDRHDPVGGLGGRRLGLDPDPGEERALLVGRERRAEQAVHPRRAGTRRGSGPGSAGRAVDPAAGDRRRRPTRRRAARPDRRRSGRAGSPGPSRTGGSPRSGARSAGRSGG